jgi:hypothetical protein
MTYRCAVCGILVAGDTPPTQPDCDRCAEGVNRRQHLGANAERLRFERGRQQVEEAKRERSAEKAAPLLFLGIGAALGSLLAWTDPLSLGDSLGERVPRCGLYSMLLLGAGV